MITQTTWDHHGLTKNHQIWKVRVFEPDRQKQCHLKSKSWILSQLATEVWTKKYKGPRGPMLLCLKVPGDKIWDQNFQVQVVLTKMRCTTPHYFCPKRWMSENEHWAGFYWSVHVNRVDDDVRLEQCGGVREVSVCFLQRRPEFLSDTASYHINSTPIQPRQAGLGDHKACR